MEGSVSPPLPHEILEQIFAHITSQSTLHACSLTSRAWYKSSIAYLYHSPCITGANFDAFIASICPSKNAHIRRNGLGELVRVLDMGRLVHNGRKSLTARLLGRLKDNLEVFVAPQATFGINCLASISKCRNLHTLNLSLVSEGIPFSSLFATLSTIPSLRTLHLPHAFVHENKSNRPTPNTNPPHIPDPSALNTETPFPFPPSLTDLHVLGGLDSSALRQLSHSPPKTLKHISLAYLTRQDWGAIAQFLTDLTSPLHTNLTSIRIGPNIARRDHRPESDAPPSAHFFSYSIRMSLQELDLLVGYFSNLASRPITSELEERRAYELVGLQGTTTTVPTFPSLRRLILRSNVSDAYCPPGDEGMGVDSELLFNFVEERAPALRIVRLDSRLTPGRRGEDEGEIRRWRQDMRFLDELLQTLAREDWEVEDLSCRSSEEARKHYRLVDERDAGLVFFTAKE